jgi:tRNA A-37 threonylcarbamoyl transferase component Bud32
MSEAAALAHDSLLDLVFDACGPGRTGPTCWRIHVAPDSADPWILVEHLAAEIPEQGWKLHVSATVNSAESVLRRVLAVLEQDGTNFKVAASHADLDTLNQGFAGLGQIGKFVTVYPQDDDQAVRLAVALHDATKGLAGPAILSDRPLRRGSLVHYRYGSFSPRNVRLSTGEVVPAVLAPDGTLVREERGSKYARPPWAVDPCARTMVAGRLDSHRIVAGRYLATGTLHQSPHGAVYSAVDVLDERPCVLKRAYRHACVGMAGRDAQSDLQHEAEVLARLEAAPGFPTPFGLTEHDGDLYLVLEPLEGRTVSELVEHLTAEARHLPRDEFVSLGRSLAEALQVVHNHALVHRDVKADNVLVAPDGSIRLIDFALAKEIGAPPAMETGGTRGYCPPEQALGQSPAVTDDVWALGALLYYVATGADPRIAPRPFALLERPVALLNPLVDRQIERVINRCLTSEPTNRFPSMRDVAAELTGLDAKPTVASFDRERRLGAATSQERFLSSAIRLGDTICHALAGHQPAQESLRIDQGEEPVMWRPIDDSIGSGIAYRDLNICLAGVVLALAEVAAEGRNPAHRTALATTAKQLAAAPRLDTRPLPGLYVGEAGVGAALLRAGQVLGNATLVKAAAARGRLVSRLPHGSPDLFNGTAGRVRFHILLWDATGRREHVDDAVAAGEVLLDLAVPLPRGRLCWSVTADGSGPEPLAHDSAGADQRLREDHGRVLGYAHGAAGVADALLDLFEVTGDERFKDAARRAGSWLLDLAEPALDDGSGLDWPTVEGGPRMGPHWCHGAAGVGRFLLHAARLNVLPDAAAYAKKAARAVALGARAATPIQCHGLAGGIEYLLDVFQATNDNVYLADALSLARVLEAFALERDGMLVWRSEAPTSVTPGYLGGYSGVAICLLRLAAPQRLPHQLTRAGFLGTTRP